MKATQPRAGYRRARRPPQRVRRRTVAGRCATAVRRPPRRGRGAQRGIALIATLFAILLLAALVAVVVDVGTVRMRKALEEARSLQATAAADAGAAWVRALCAQRAGDLQAVLADLAGARGTLRIRLDRQTLADVRVSLALPGASPQSDHLDVNLQENPAIAEQPVQVTAAATVIVNGAPVAARTVTTLLRTFHHVAPYSEIVGEIDGGGLEEPDSPGDPAGQVGGPSATDLRIFARVRSGSGPPASADDFRSRTWYDGNAGMTGILP
jgi:type II secretory pathway pseudopilin PulG